MALNFLLKRSSTADKRPDPNSMAFGEIDLNYDPVSGGVFYKDSAGDVVKVGPAQVSSAAPNSSPAGSSGNSVGEFWYDTANSALNIWSGSAWVATNTNSAYVANSAYTAKGVLLVGSAPNTPIALAVGTDGYVLVADSTEATGLKWVTAPSGGVTSITAGTGLTGGTITTTGTIALDTSGVTANSYTFANVTVDTYGRVTAASNGGDATTSAKGIVQVGTNIDVASGVISVADGSSVVKGVLQVGTNLDVASGVVSVADSSTSTKGVVQLNNTTTSTSTSLALTAAQGKSLQDQIDALAVTSNIILGGTFNANTGFVSSVTTEGTAAGLAVGSVLPAASSGNADYFVIVDVQGTNGPNSPTLVHVGDWFLSDGTTWQFLNVGFAPGQATTSSQGVVQLATDAEVQAGTDSSNAVVSSSLQSKLSDSTSTTSSSTIASSTAVKSAYDLAAAALPKDVFTAKGDIISGTGSATYVALPVGTNGQVLSADSTAASGLSWISVSGSGTVTSITAGTGLTGGTITTSGTIALANTEVTPGSYTNSSITVDAQGRLTAASSGTAPVTSVTATGPITSSGGTTPVISTSMATNKLLGRSTAGTGVAEEITVGTNLTLSAGTLSAPAFATAAQMQGVATTATATSGATTITVASGTGIADGDSVYGVGIVPGTAVASGGGTTSIVLDTAIVNTLSATPATFNTNQTIVTPGDTGGGLLRAWVTYNPQQTGTWPGGASTVFRAAASTTATITGANNHGLNVGSRVYALTGVAQVTNGYVVVSVLDAKRFTITTTASTLLNNVAITFYVSLIYNSYNIHTIFHANGLNSINGIMYNFITPAPNIYYGFVGTSSGSAVIFTQGSNVNTTSTFNVQPWQLANLSNMPNGVASIMVFG